jgi:hypothetical protein
MPDITMCSGTNCPLKETCYRYTATPSEFMQSYFVNPPIKEDETCDYYWKIESPKTKENDRNNI